MIHKINKKMLFGFSLALSSIFSLLFSISRKSDVNILSLITEVPIGSIERVSAMDGGGDCCGSSDFSNWISTANTAISSAVYITLEDYPGGAVNWSNEAVSAAQVDTSVGGFGY